MVHPLYKDMLSNYQEYFREKQYVTMKADTLTPVI